MDITNSLNWLNETKLWWVIYAVVSLVGYTCYYFLMQKLYYKK
jgi:hypothetical protein